MSLMGIIMLAGISVSNRTGSEAYSPLAHTIIGGLSLSVVLTIVPAAYYLVHRSKDQGLEARKRL